MAAVSDHLGTGVLGLLLHPAGFSEVCGTSDLTCVASLVLVMIGNTVTNVLEPGTHGKL